MSTPPMTMPVIGPGRLYHGFLALVGVAFAGAGVVVWGGGAAGFGAAAAEVDVAAGAVDAAAAAAPAAGAAAAAGVDAFAKRTFKRVVPGVSTLIGGISCTGSFVTPSSAITPSIL
jgi:hypothetical protein